MNNITIAKYGIGAMLIIMLSVLYIGRPSPDQAPIETQRVNVTIAQVDSAGEQIGTMTLLHLVEGSLATVSDIENSIKICATSEVDDRYSLRLTMPDNITISENDCETVEKHDGSIMISFDEK